MRYWKIAIGAVRFLVLVQTATEEVKGKVMKREVMFQENQNRALVFSDVLILQP